MMIYITLLKFLQYVSFAFLSLMTLSHAQNIDILEMVGHLVGKDLSFIAPFLGADLLYIKITAALLLVVEISLRLVKTDKSKSIINLLITIIVFVLKLTSELIPDRIRQHKSKPQTYRAKVGFKKIVKKVKNKWLRKLFSI